MLYSSASAQQELTCKLYGIMKDQFANIFLAEILTKRIKSFTSTFSQRFRKIFNPKRPFTDPKYAVFSRSLFSNLVGGIGYFYGDSLVDRSYAPEYEELDEGFWQETAEARDRAKPQIEGPSELFTSIPSRPFFPRGFLWDEGFHLMPVVDWDIDLAYVQVSFQTWGGVR